MLITLIFWVYLTFVFLSYGTGMLALVRRVQGVSTSTSLPFTIVLLLGLSVTAWWSSVMSWVMKLGMTAHLLILAGACLIFFFQYDEIKALFLSVFSNRHWTTWLLILFVFVTTLLYAVKPPDNPDTPLYHAQAIHWIEAYPAVPGLGNLESRLGMNSNWFTLSALFSLSFLGGRSFHLVPSFLFLVSILYFLSGFQKILEGNLHLSQIVKLSLIPAAFYVLLDELSSPGTDLPVILFYWVILCLWLESLEQENTLLSFVVFLFSVFVMTYKLSGLTILLIAVQVLFVLLRKSEKRTFLLYAALAVLALFPWLVRNFILTGYWVYPEPLMQIFSPKVDWAIPVDRVLALKRGVQAWSLSPGITWDTVSELSWPERFRFWFSDLTSNRKTLVLAGFVSPVVFVIFSWLFQRNEKRTMFIPVVTIGFLNFLFWVFVAPNFRFGYGFVLGMIVLGFAPLLQVLLEALMKYRLYLVIAIAFVLLLQQGYAISGAPRDGTDYSQYTLLPADYRSAPTSVCSFGDQKILCASKLSQCGYHAFPCVRKPPVNIEMRGDSLSDGFRRISVNP